MAEHVVENRSRGVARRDAGAARRPAGTAGAAGALIGRGGALAQLRAAFAQHPRVAQMARLSAALQRRVGSASDAQGAGAVVQRAAEHEEEELVQAKAAAHAHVSGAEAAVQRAPNRTGLPDGLKGGVESLSGMDLSDVRVHRNSAQPASLDALAYAQGTDIHVAPGQDHHLPHEAWHVVQQMQGRVQPTGQVSGVALNDDGGLETEADRMGARALQMARRE
jgi:hypothetical protein